MSHTDRNWSDIAEWSESLEDHMRRAAVFVRHLRGHGFVSNPDYLDWLDTIERQAIRTNGYAKGRRKTQNTSPGLRESPVSALNAETGISTPERDSVDTQGVPCAWYMRRGKYGITGHRVADHTMWRFGTVTPLDDDTLSTYVVAPDYRDAAAKAHELFHQHEWGGEGNG